MKRIVLTGGPCSGKTTGLHYLYEKLSDYGLSVVVVPEVATQIINGGIGPQELLRRVSRRDYLKFEETIIKKQMSDERHYGNLLRAKGGKKQVLLMDRGCMDMAAYLRPEEFELLLNKNHWSLVGLRDKRYEAVFHLVTAADGKEKFYNLDNPTRYETPEEARKTDKRTQEAWVGHPHLVIIDNSFLFEEKMKRLIRAAQKSIGMPVSLEIKRKFLVKGFSIQKLPVPYQRLNIDQAYLVSKDGGATAGRIRKRKQGEAADYYQTFKIPSASAKAREERETQISAQRYYELLSQRDPERKTIHKERCCFIWKNQYFELDLFLEPYHCWGLMLLEVELTKENDRVEIPDWLGEVREITGEPGWRNYDLAKRPV